MITFKSKYTITLNSIIKAIINKMFNLYCLIVNLIMRNTKALTLLLYVIINKSFLCLIYCIGKIFRCLEFINFNIDYLIGLSSSLDI